MAIGRAVASLFVRLGIDTNALKAGAAQARSEVKTLENSLQGGAGAAGLLQTALGAIGIIGLGYAAKEAASFAYEMGKVGAQSLQVKQALDDLTRGTGTSMEQLVSAVQDAAGGTVSEFDTMLALNRGILLGMGSDVNQWADLMEVARFKARAMGVDTTQALNDIATGIGRESRMILDNLGIILDTDAITKEYAATLGKTADQLTAAERKQALMNAVIADGQRQIAEAGGLTDNYADSFAKLDASLADLKGRIAEGLAPAVSQLADAMAQLLDSGEQFGELEGKFAWLQDLLAQWEGIRGGGDIANAILREQGEAALDAATALGELGQAEQLLAEEAKAAGVTIEEAALARLVAAQQNVEGLKEERNALLAARAAGEEVYQSHIDMANAELRAAAAARDAAEALYLSVNAGTEAGAAYSVAEEELNKFGGTAVRTSGSLDALTSGMMTSAQAARRMANTLFGLQDAIAEVGSLSVDDIISDLPSTAGAMDTKLLGLVGTAGGSTVAGLRQGYVKEIEALYTSTALAIEQGAEITDFELAMQVEAIKDKYGDMADAYTAGTAEVKRAVKSSESIWDEMRSVVQGALQATQVTAEDMGLADIGQYVDKWDENARRLDAVAERGFAELDAHPDWAEMLKIPPEVLAAGEDALKSWAGRIADSVRDLERPDLLNLDAAVDAVQAELNRQAAVELSLDLVTKAAIEEGLVTGEDAKAQVAEALGLSEALPVNLTVSAESKAAFVSSLGTVPAPVSLAITDEEKEAFAANLATVPVPVSFSMGETETAEGGGFDEAMAAMVATLQEGWTASVAEVPWLSQVIAAIAAEVRASEGKLRDVGLAIGGPMWDGMAEKLGGTGIVDAITAAVLAALVAETG